MTLLVALGLPTAVKFWPVLVSWAISEKELLTTLSGTTTLRGSTKSDVLVLPVVGDRDCPCAASETVQIMAINSAAARLSCDPSCMSLMPGLICILLLISKRSELSTTH